MARMYHDPGAKNSASITPHQERKRHSARPVTSRVPLVPGPSGQVFVRWMVIPRTWGPGKHEARCPQRGATNSVRASRERLPHHR
jgi:hypothetical protein